MQIQFNPTKKQDELFETFGNENYLEVLFGGAAGGGKSFALWALMILKCIEYPGIRIGLARQTLTQIKNNTITTFYELCTLFNLKEDIHYKYNEMKGSITFFNKSEIKFVELRYLPSDPFYDRFGGALFTFGAIEEAAGCDQKGKEVFSSRLGRWMNDEYSIPPHLYLTCNPGTNFVYSDFYIPWIKGELANHRAYIPALLSDNKYQSKYYADALEKRLGLGNAKRLLEGQWDFDDDRARLMTFENISDIFNIPKHYSPSGAKYITADIAFTGDDCVVILWQGYDILKINIYDGDQPDVYLEQLSREHNVPQENIAYDADGVGKYIKGKLPRAKEIINNSVPYKNENYVNKKAQLNFKLAELVNNGIIKCYDIKYIDRLQQELYEIKSPPLETVDGKLKIVSKAEVKKILGRSPDIADAMAFRMVFEFISKPVMPRIIR